MKARASTSGLHSAMLICCLGLFAASLSPVRSAAAEEQPAPARYDIPALPLAQALALFGQQTGVQLTAAADLTRDRHSAPLTGEYPIEEALRRLLADSGLEARRTAPSTFELVAQPQTARPAESPPAPRLPATRLSPLLVQAERPEDEIYLRPYAVSHISREDIERIGPRHPSEILQAIPGVFTVTNEQIPSVSVNIRGLKDFGRVNMNIDGMRQNYQRSGHGQRNGEMFFDTEFLSGVEITKGAAAGAGSGGANAGVATFRTLRADDVLSDSNDRFAARLRLTSGVGEYGNAQNPSGSLALATRPTSNTDLLLAYSMKDTGEYQPGKNGQAFYPPNIDVPASIVNATGQEMDSWLVKGSWYPGVASTLRLTALSTVMEYGESQEIDYNQAYWAWFCDRRGSGSGGGTGVPSQDAQIDATCDAFEYDPDNVYPVSNVNKTDTQSYALDYFWNAGGNLLDLRGKIYWVTTRNDSVLLSNPFTLTTRTDTVGAILANTSTFQGGRHLLRLDYGVEAFRDRNKPDADSLTMTGEALQIASGMTPEGERLIGSAWLKADWNYRALTVSPGVRYDYYRLWGITGFSHFNSHPDVGVRGEHLWQYELIDVDHHDSRVLPSLGLAWQIRDSATTFLQVFANASLSWRPPAITETLTASAVPYHVPPVRTYPNWLLRPEETFSWEAGANLILRQLLTPADSFRLKLVHFRNSTDDYIFFVDNVGLPGHYTLLLPGSVSMYVNATNRLSFHGEELELNYDAPRFYTGLTLTHTRRETGAGQNGILSYELWPLGSLDGNPCPASYASDAFWGCTGFGSVYDPMIPEWSGQLTVGLRFFGARLDLGSQLLCAERTGDHRFGGAFFENANGRQLGQRSFCVVHAYGSYALNSHLKLGMNLRNLTDREYAQAMGDGMVRSYAPGRTLTAFLEARF